MNRTLNRELTFQLVETARLLRTHVDQRARRHGTTRAQWGVLGRLRRGDGQTQAALAEQMELQPISLARLIDKLEAQGFVARRADPKDRRVHRLHLTAEGRGFVDGLDGLREEIAADILGGADEAALATALSVLSDIRHRIAQAGHPPAGTAHPQSDAA